MEPLTLLELDLLNSLQKFKNTKLTVPENYGFGLKPGFASNPVINNLDTEQNKSKIDGTALMLALQATGQLANAGNEAILDSLDDSPNSNNAQNLVYKNSWGEVLNNSKRRSDINDMIMSERRDFSDVNNIYNLQNVWDPNMQQSSLKKMDGWETFGTIGTSALSDAASGAATGFAAGTVIPGIGQGIGAGVGAAAGFLSGLGRGVIGAIQGNNTVDYANKLIDQTNSYNLNNYFDTAKNIRKNMYRNIAAEGGPMESLNGLTFFNTGGTHGSNPLGGIPQGVDSEGVPNLVEQGEVKYNDYIFSSRNKISERLLNKYNLPKNLAGKTFAEVATKLQEDSQERPYDPVSVNGLEDSMGKLIAAQEEVRAKKAAREQRNVARQFAIGGNLYNNIPPVDEDEQELFYDTRNPWLSRHLLYTNLNNYTPEVTEPTIVSNDETTPGIKQSNKTKADKRRNLNNRFTFTPSHLRYFPAVSTSLQALTDQLGLTNRPDYTLERMIRRNASNLNPVAPNLNENYLEYKPLNTELASNRLDEQAASRARLARENRNKSSQMSFIQGVDNTAGINSFLANLEAQQANQKLRQTISQYNNAIDAANQNIATNYDKLNLELLGNKLNMLNAAAQARDASDTARGQTLSTNRTNAANQIGKVGLDATNFELQRILGESGAYGVLNKALLNFINSQLGGRG